MKKRKHQSGEISSLPKCSRIDNRLREKLCCPSCKGALQYEEDKTVFRCVVCGKSYPIEADVPNLVYYSDAGGEQTNFNKVQAQYERDVHDQEAETYEDDVVKAYGDKTELIATAWAKALPGEVLDYGCGTGQLSRVLKRYYSPVYAFDISSVSVSMNIKDNDVLAVASNAFHLPFRNKCFETVLCNGVLHHIVDLRSAITEMARISNRFIAISELCTIAHYRIFWKIPLILRRTAKALLQTIGLLRSYGQLKQYFRLSGESKGSNYERPLEPGEIIKLLEEVGFKVTMQRFWTNFGWRRRSRLKKVLIRTLLSNKAGTHFEIRAERLHLES